MKKIVVGITGASGVILGVRLLQELKDKVETHLVLTESARKIIKIEAGIEPDAVEKTARFSYCNNDFCAVIASGSFLFDSMVVIPCSIKSLSAIAMSYADTLLVRAADVALKEGRKLILCVREMPFHEGHLSMMGELARRGVIICPPVLALYNNPRTVNDIVNFFVGKVLDLLGMENCITRRWSGSDGDCIRTDLLSNEEKEISLDNSR